MVCIADMHRVREGDVIFVPPMEPVTARLTAAVFRALGYGAEVLIQSPATLAAGLACTAGGECLPCPATIGSMLATIETRRLDPARVVFFMPSTCGPCRFGQYATLADMAFARRGWDAVRVLAINAENSYGGLRSRGRRLLWHAIVLSDFVRKIVLKQRPYEATPGEVDRVTEGWVARMAAEIEAAKPDLAGALEGYVAALEAVPCARRPKPKVALVGEIYVRNDPFTNQGLIRAIEDLGGEVLASTIAEWVLFCNAIEGFRTWTSRKFRRSRLTQWLERTWFTSVERAYARAASRLVSDREEPDIRDVIAAGEKYVPREFHTETILTIGRAVLFIEREKVDAVVNASPMFCMPGTISASIFARVQEEYGVPVISNFYDGSGDPNKTLAPYLHYLVERKEGEAAAGTELARGARRART
jgi:predicted nucleotide-binding protein (sugar kinase/HSP70/actin superfamily)